MKTTLNFPDNLIRDAKMQAVAEHTTLTKLIIEGLETRLKGRKLNFDADLPVSAADGGLITGYSWDQITKSGAENGDYR
jgi:hypothetical protein